MLMLVVAQISLSAFAVESKPEIVASEATNQVLMVLRKNRALFEQDQQKYYTAVANVLSPLIAFDKVARGVMGKYVHRSSPAQVDKFVQVFRESIIRFYGNAVMTLDPARLKLSRVEPVRDEQLSDYVNRKIRSIPVNLKVESDNHEYSLSYSMILEDRQWKARNIIIEGINVGAQFRNQFASAMRQYKDVDKVIANWAAIMGNQAEIVEEK